MTKDLDLGEEENRQTRGLVEVCSSTPDILVMHLTSWDYLQAWTREREKTFLVNQVRLLVTRLS